MNTPIDLPSVGRAIERMREKYPTERTSLNVDFMPSGYVRFVAFVGEAEENRKVGWADDPVAAVDDLFRRAGDRNLETLRQAKIDALKKQIEALQAQPQREHGTIVAQV